MELIKVQSSNIEQIGFEENKSITMNQKPINILRIIFTSGITYDYYNVEKEVYEQFSQAKSVGSYFHKFIKNQYQYEKTL
jgi:hypothetical protein